jgi:vitamin B12 transporter
LPSAATIHSMLRRCSRLLLGATSLTTTAIVQAEVEEPATEVLVRANSVDRRSARDETVHSTVLRREDIDQPGTSTATAIGRAPSAQLQRSGSDAETATASLRGTTSAQLPVYLGPFALNDELTGSVDLSLVPLFFIDRIEIYRGHAPSFVDRLGLGGAVVLEPKLPKRPEAYAGATLGSYGASTLYAGASTGNDHAGNLIAAERSTAANNYPYWDNRGTVMDTTDDRRVLRSNADAETVQFWNSGYYRPRPSTRLRWLLHGLRREQGVTGLSIIPARHARASTQRELAAITATLPCRSEVAPAACRVELLSQLQRTTLSLSDPGYELGYGTNHIDSQSMQSSERLRIEHRVLPELSLGWLLGADLGSLEITNAGSEGLTARRRSGLVGLNVDLSLSPAVSFLALGRVSAEHTVAEGTAARMQQMPSGRLGMRTRLSEGLTLRANVGHYARLPTLGQLYGASASLRGNPDLLAEQGLSEDLGLAWNFTKGSLRATTEAVIYHQRTRNLVAWRRSSFGQIRPYNVGQARLIGAELFAGLVLMRSLRLEGTLGVLDPRDITPSRVYTNDILPYRSRLSGNLRFEAGLPQENTIRGLRTAAVGLTVSGQSSRYIVPAGNAVIPSSTTVALDGRLAFFAVPLLLRASVMNLFDRQTFDLLGMPLPGRSCFVGAEVNLDLSP